MRGHNSTCCWMLSVFNRAGGPARCVFCSPNARVAFRRFAGRRCGQRSRHADWLKQFVFAKIDDLQETEEPTISLPVWGGPALWFMFLRIRFPCSLRVWTKRWHSWKEKIKQILSKKKKNVYFYFPIGPNFVEHHQKCFLAVSRVKYYYISVQYIYCMPQLILLWVLLFRIVMNHLHWLNIKSF